MSGMTCSWTCKVFSRLSFTSSTTNKQPRSDPKSPNYGQHLSREEVLNMFSPASETVEAVKKWITSSGISEDRISRSENNQVTLTARLPIMLAEHP